MIETQISNAFLPAPGQRFLAKIRAVTGFEFPPGRVEDLAGAPLHVGEVIQDQKSGRHCLVLDAERAACQDFCVLRASGNWRRPAEACYVAVTSDIEGPARIAWHDHQTHAELECIFQRSTARMIPAGLRLSRDIAGQLPLYTWEGPGPRTVYLAPRLRLCIALERNDSICPAEAFLEHDPDASSQALATDLVEIVGPELSPRATHEVIRSLACRLIDAPSNTAGAGATDALGDLLRELLGRLDARQPQQPAQ